MYPVIIAPQRPQRAPKGRSQRFTRRGQEHGPYWSDVDSFLERNFLAKQILRGHLCLHGDVPAALLSVGKPGDVAAYCRKLIDQVGEDGGFILGTGCGVPINVTPDNFAAMIETGKSYHMTGT